MKPLLLALAALLLLSGPASARTRCAPGETALKSGVCATLRPHSAVPPPQTRACLGGGRADRLGRCRAPAPCSGGSCGTARLTPGPPVVALPQPAPLQVPPPNVPNLAPPPLVYTPGAGLH